MTASALTATVPGALESKRAWTPPTLHELPKLSALTLASAIGGGGSTTGSGSTVFALFLAVGLLLGAGACTPDRSIIGEPGAGAPVTSQVVSCTVDRASLSIDCASPSASPGTITLGGQGTVVALRSSGVALTVGADTVLSANVTVQNLSAGPIGTIDGVTPSGNGIRVFFVAPPLASPSGSVDVKNETGTATFTAGGQEYFEYPGMLVTQATSAPITWEFRFHGAATSFTFAVLISTDVPAAGAIVRWAPEIGFGAVNWASVRGWGADGLVLYGSGGQVMVRDGGSWRARPDPVGKDPVSAVWTGGVGPQELYSMVDNGGTASLRQWDGINWRDLFSFGGAPSPTFLASKLVVRGHNDLFAYGFRFYRFNGTTWTNLGVPNAPTNDRIYTASVLNGKILALDKDGGVWQWDDVSWTKVIATNSGQNRQPSMILAADLNHVWVFDNGFPYTEVMYWDGVSWTAQALPHTLAEGYTARGGAVLSATDVYLVAGDGAGFGYVWHWDGTSWTQVRNVSGRGYNDIWARNGNEIYLAGSQGWVEMGNGEGSWLPVIQPVGGGNTKAIRVISNGDVYVGSATGEIMHFNGTDWTMVASLGGLRSIWAWSSGSVWATGNGSTVAHFDGSGWSFPTLPTSAYAIAGWAPGDLWAVGANGGISHYHGASWSEAVATNTTFGDKSLDAVWAGSANFAAAVGQDGTIAQWNGSSWSAATSPTGAYLHAISGVDDTHAWAVGEFGTVVKWDGTSWTASNIGTAADLRGVWAASPTEVYVTSAGGAIYLYNGSSWTPVSLPSIGGAQIFEQVHGKVNGRVYVTGTRLLRGTR